MTSSDQLLFLSQTSTIQDAIDLWTLYLEDQGRSPHTINAFSADMKLFASYFSVDKTVSEIGTDDINKFLDWMQNERGVSCSPKTLSRRITSIKSFFKWLQQSGAIMVNPSDKVIQKSVISPLPEVLLDVEQDAVLEAAYENLQAPDGDARQYVLLKLLLETGIKKAECLNLTTNHLEIKNGEAEIFIRYAAPQYRYRERNLKLSADWVEAYKKYEAQYKISDQLFPWSQRLLEYVLEDIGEQAGIKKHLSFMMCRWTSALNDFRKGTDLEELRIKMGVSKIQFRELKMKLTKLSKNNY